MMILLTEIKLYYSRWILEMGIKDLKLSQLNKRSIVDIEIEHNLDEINHTSKYLFNEGLTRTAWSFDNYRNFFIFINVWN